MTRNALGWTVCLVCLGLLGLAGCGSDGSKGSGGDAEALEGQEAAAEVAETLPEAGEALPEEALGEADTCPGEVATEQVSSIKLGCKAIFDAFPEGIPAEPVKILNAVAIKDLCDCVSVMNPALEACPFASLEAAGLTGIPAALVDNLGLAGSVCGTSDERCPTAEDFTTDDIDPVRDYFDGFQGYAHVPHSTLEAYQSWPCYAFWEEYITPGDPASGIVDYPWMWDAQAQTWPALPLSRFWPTGTGRYNLQYEESTVFIDLFMWSGGPNWYFDYYCFADNVGKMLSEHLEIILVDGELPAEWQDVVVEKMGRKGYDVQGRIMPRVLDFTWECPAPVPYPDPNGQ
jgi:hypothetical protein